MLDEFLLRRPDGSTFLAKYPVWTVMGDEVLRSHGATRALFCSRSSSIGRFFPLYTDEHLVGRFIEESGVGGISPYQLDDYAALGALLYAAHLCGVTHVGIDCPAGPNPRDEWSLYPPITAVSLAVLGLS